MRLQTARSLQRIIILFIITVLIFSSFTGAKFSYINNDAANKRQEDITQGEVLDLTSSHVIRFKAALFDPLKEEPRLSKDWNYIQENNYFLAQCMGPIQSSWFHEIESKGAKILRYIPDNTYLIHIKSERIESVENLPFIRWIGSYQPIYKIQQGLLDREGGIELNVLVFKDEEDNLQNVRNELMALGGTITYDGEGNHIIRVKIDAQKIRDIVLIPEVEWIDEYSPPRAFMNKVRVFTGANTVLNPGGFNGSGIVGEVKDDGIDQNHPDFEGRLIGTVGDPPDLPHGNCAFGIVFSSGKNDSDATGMLPGGEGVFCDWSEPRLTSISNLVFNWGGVFQSNSWSTGDLDSQYTTSSLENDQAVDDYEVVLLHSVGNSGDGIYPQSCSQDSVAKNVIGVGAVYHWDDLNPANDEWTDFFGPGSTPSQGPASDGRIKPDLVGPFDSIYTTDSTDGDAHDGYVVGDYYEFGGTSAATPVVAGAVGLVYQMYQENHFGNNPTGLQPHAATVKAILIADAYQYEFSKANRYQQGWGGVNVENVYNIGENHFIVDESKSIQESETARYIIEPTGGPLKISLVWTDVPSTTSSSQHLVNDLNLKVTDPNDNVYWGNNGLETSKWSSAGGSADSLNNVENVFIQNPTDGVWTLEIIGERINLDGDPTTPGKNDQGFALVAANAAPILYADITYPNSNEKVNDIVTVNGTSTTDVIQIQVKIDDGSWVPATGTTDWFYDWNTNSYSDGTHTIYVRGYNGTAYSGVELVNVIVDNTPPTTTLTIGVPKHGDEDDLINVTSHTMFSLDASDNLAGVDFSWFYINDVQNYGVYTAPFNLSSYGEGTYTLYYGSTDILGNNESSLTLNFITIVVDDSGPTTNLSISIPKYGGEMADVNVTTDTLFTLNATDNPSTSVGVNFIWYSIEGDYYIYSSPFDFTSYGEGTYTLTYGSDDHLGNSEAGSSLIVTVDESEPISTLTIGFPKHGDEVEDINVTSSTQFTVSATDGAVGNLATWWYVNEIGNYSETTTFDFTGFGEGSHTLYYGGLDLLGNNDTTPSSLEVIVDDSKPMTTLNIGTPKSGDEVNDINVTSSTSLTLNAIDYPALSAGVDFTWYTIETDYYVYNGSFNFSNYGEGIYTLTYGSEDQLGNKENETSLTILVDDTEPTATLNVGHPKTRKRINNYWNVTSSTTFTIITEDSAAGIDIVWYTIDGHYFEGTSFNLSDFDEGYLTITWGSIDKLGNTNTGNMTVYLHKTPPITTLDLQGEKYRESIEHYWNITEETQFMISTAPINPGINFTWYTIDGEYFKLNPKSNSFNLEGFDEGLHVITWGSEDMLGLNETGNTIFVFLDTSSPETEIEIDAPKYRADIEDHWSVKRTTPFTLQSKDNYSGVSFTWYVIDDEYYEGTSFALSGLDDGEQTIVWGSKDNLGHNESEHTITVYLDDTPPSITFDIGLPNRISDDLTYITSSTPITLNLVDDGVNNSIIYYSFDWGTTYYAYGSPFTVTPETTAITYWGEDIMGNQATEYTFYVTVDNQDSDGDGIYDLGDDDDDNDGLLDSQEDKNQNGIVDPDETDPLNPDTDGDGLKDGVDLHPLKKSEGGEDINLAIILLVILLVIVITLILFFFVIQRQKKNKEAKVEWADEKETYFESQKEQAQWSGGDETTFEPEEEVDWTEEEKLPPPPPPKEELPPPPPNEEVEFEPEEEVQWS
ncbi:MAG: S8 family serine peptidase [Thermoplasmata archaeon]|nr:MAG: S8 family serine peptidase [Thermoplasmata archaeon]